MSENRNCQVDLTVQECRKVAAALMLSDLVAWSLQPNDDAPVDEDTLLRSRFENAAAIGELERQLDEFRGVDG